MGFIEEIKFQLFSIIEKLHYQKREEAYNVFNVVIDKLLLLLEDISQKREHSAIISEMNTALIQCLEAMEKQDDILVADILEDEIIPRLILIGEVYE